MRKNGKTGGRNSKVSVFHHTCVEKHYHTCVEKHNRLFFQERRDENTQSVSKLDDYSNHFFGWMSLTACPAFIKLSN